MLIELETLRVEEKHKVEAKYWVSFRWQARTLGDFLGSRLGYDVYGSLNTKYVCAPGSKKKERDPSTRLQACTYVPHTEVPERGRDY